MRPRTAESVIAWRRGAPITTGRYLADVAACAKLLPAGCQVVVNLCVDRYAFAVTLAAALSRGALSLLPPNARADTMAPLAERHPGLVGLTDDAALHLPGLPLLRWAVDAPAPYAAAPMPPAAAVGPGGAPAAALASGCADAAAPAVAAHGPAACLLTSGSTGVPQPHHKSWHQEWLNIDAEARRLAEHLGLPDLSALTLVATVPPQHSYGFESSVLLAMLGGAAFEAGRPFYPADIAAALDSVPRPRALVTTPFHLKALLGAGIPLPAVDLVLSATAPLSPQLARLAERLTGGALVEIYGCTEAGQVATRRTAATETWTTFGELRIHAEPGPPGSGTAEAFLVQGGHVLEATPLSDILVLHGGREFELLGRANDLIHVAGKRSSLGHLNHQLNSIEGIEDGAFWLPDEVADGVVRPVVFVVAPTLSAEQVRTALRQRLEPVFVPRRVVHVDALPREATGKLTVHTLRRFALQTLGLSR